MKFRRVVGLLCFASALTLVGCGGSTNTSFVPPNPVYRFINASPNTSSVTFTINDAALATNLAYLDSTTTFQEIEPGDSDLTVYADGSNEAAWSEGIGPERDKNYFAIAFGINNPPVIDQEKRLRLGILTIDRTTPNNGARLILFHAYNRASGFSTPPIDFQNPGDNPQYKSEGITFGNAVVITINAGTQTFVARRNATEAEITPQVTKNFEAGKIYLVIISGIEGAVGAQAPKISFVEVQTK